MVAKRALMAAWLGCVALSESSTVAAQQAPAEVSVEHRQALNEFEAGVEASERGAWGEACEHFGVSNALIERASTLFNLALCSYRVGRPVVALEYAERFLSLTNQLEHSGDRHELQALIEQARAEVALLSLHVAPEHAQVRLDGALRKERGPTRSFWLDAGQYELRVSAEGYIEERLELSVEAGTEVQRSLSLRPAEVVRAQPAALPSLPTAKPSRPSTASPVVVGDSGTGGLPTWLWITGGVVIAAGVAAVVSLAITDHEDNGPKPVLRVLALGGAR